MNENDAEIVATCEAAVTWLTDENRGWTQGEFSNDEVFSSDGINYASASACLGGALVLTTVLDDPELNIERVPRFTLDWDERLDSCPALPAVAAVIRERHPEVIADPDYAPGPGSLEEAKAVIFTFNDADDTTVDDVIDVLTETIKRHTPDAYSVTGDASPDGTDTGGAPGA